MRVSSYLIVLGLAISTSIYPQPSPTETRDYAIHAIEACVRGREASSRKCRGLHKHIQTLIDVYWQEGDKSVLPVLLKFSWLTAFYDQALIADPESFLAAVSHLPEQDQQAVVSGIAGGQWGVARDRFDRVRATLMNVSNSSSNYQLARACLARLETENALYVVDYFPPQTFTGRAGDFELQRFSRELYALGESAMWPPASASEQAFRVTVLPAFTPPQTVILRVTSDGAGQIEFRTTDARTRRLIPEGPHVLPVTQVIGFNAALNRVQYWQSLTELPPAKRAVAVFDPTFWLLEGVRDGKYHVTFRVCHGQTPLGEAAFELFDLSGHKSAGRC